MPCDDHGRILSHAHRPLGPHPRPPHAVVDKDDLLRVHVQMFMHDAQAARLQPRQHARMPALVAQPTRVKLDEQLREGEGVASDPILEHVVLGSLRDKARLGRDQGHRTGAHMGDYM